LKALELGQVSRPHGIRGELRLRLHHEQGTTLLEVPEVILSLPPGQEARYRVAQARRSGKAVLLRLEGVDSREAAEALRGARVLVERELLAPLADDEYYLADLVGCSVEGPAGRLGVVEAVQTHPSVDSLLIRTPQGQSLEQPLDDSWIDSVSVSERRIVLKSEDGLID